MIRHSTMSIFILERLKNSGCLMHELGCLSNPNLLRSKGIVENHWSSVHAGRLKIQGSGVSKEESSSSSNSSNIDGFASET